jgi:phospholipase D1/2
VARLYVAAVLIFAAVLVTLWWQSELPATPATLADAAAPYRDEWSAVLLVVVTFVVFGLMLFPILLLIAATGIAFGPVLGPVYAMTGALACGAAGFAIGRHLGRRRAKVVVGGRVANLMTRLKRNGTLTVFLVRKVPAPFTLVNIAIGASAVSFRDFILGTALAMSAGVIALAGFGSQVGELFRDPSPAGLARAAVLFGLSLMAALVINLLVRSRSAA